MMWAGPPVAPIVGPGESNIIIDSKTLEQCLKSTSYFGRTLYTNLCTGTQTAVPWGGFDWIVSLGLLILGGALGVAVLTILVALAWNIITDF